MKNRGRGQKGTVRGQTEKVWKPLILLGKTKVSRTIFMDFVPCPRPIPLYFIFDSFITCYKVMGSGDRDKNEAKKEEMAQPRRLLAFYFVPQETNTCLFQGTKYLETKPKKCSNHGG